MDQKCGYGDCPGSPKFACYQDQSKVFCDYHIEGYLQQHPAYQKIPYSARTSASTTALIEAGKLSNAISDVFLTGKDMFQEICSKLCAITDDLVQRQKDLFKLATNVTEAENPVERIQKLGELNHKLRTKDEFSKLVEQHFSRHDSTVDFSLFKEDIKGIMDSLKLSNQCIETVREESGKDREAREEIMKRLEVIENNSESTEKQLSQRIKDLSEEMKLKDKKYGTNKDIEDMQKTINKIEQASASFINQVNSRFGNIEKQNRQQSKHKEEADEINLNFRNQLNKDIEDKISGLENSYLNKIADINKTLAERTEAFRKAEHEMRLNFEQTAKIESDKLADVRERIEKKADETFNKVRSEVETIENKYIGKLDQGVGEVRDSYRNEIEKNHRERNEVFEWIRRQIEDNCQAAGQQRKVINFEEFVRLEKIRIEEERKKAEEERKIAIFNDSPLEEKKKHLESLQMPQYIERFVNDKNRNIQEIRITNDGLYAFVCKFYSGKIN